MFEREHHRRIATVLEALDAQFLVDHHCLFGGGTAIALKYGEYRDSVDVDFLVSDVNGYRTLRQCLSGQAGIRHIARKEATLTQVRELATLTSLDMAATKLLANSDRWADDSVNSRDLIDLAMMRLDKKTLREAISKASAAYGTSIENDLAKAIDALRRRPGRLADCMESLQMTTEIVGVPRVPPAVVWKRIRALAPKANAVRAPKR